MRTNSFAACLLALCLMLMHHPASADSAKAPKPSTPSLSPALHLQGALARKAVAPLSAKVATKKTGWAERFSLELPFQVNVIGLSFGLQPELLFRPISADSGLHLRVAIGFYGGSELFHVAPLAIGARWVWLRNWWVQPFLGLGMVWQMFVPYDAEVFNRIDLTFELGLRVNATNGWSIGINISPEFGLWAFSGLGFQSTFGLGLATRLTVTKDLPF